MATESGKSSRRPLTLFRAVIDGNPVVGHGIESGDKVGPVTSSVEVPHLPTEFDLS
jgi:hypothetical protein